MGELRGVIYRMSMFCLLLSVDCRASRALFVYSHMLLFVYRHTNAIYREGHFVKLNSFLPVLHKRHYPGQGSDVAVLTTCNRWHARARRLSLLFCTLTMSLLLDDIDVYVVLCNPPPSSATAAQVIHTLKQVDSHLVCRVLSQVFFSC